MQGHILVGAQRNLRYLVSTRLPTRPEYEELGDLPDQYLSEYRGMDHNRIGIGHLLYLAHEGILVSTEGNYSV